MSSTVSEVGTRDINVGDEDTGDNKSVECWKMKNSEVILA